MKIFKTSTIKEIDAFTIEHEPILSINLMERASRELFAWMKARLTPSPVMVFAGWGNNGGDALALARLLHLDGWDVSVFLFVGSGLSPDTAINLERLRHLPKITIRELNQDGLLPTIDNDCLVVDGLFGAGLNRPLDGMAAKLVGHINEAGVRVLSIDMPSGLMGEDNSTNHHNAIVRSTFTLTFQFPKLSFLFSENEVFVGEWHVLEIGLHRQKIAQVPTDWHFVDKDLVKSILPTRDKFAHKGKFGHALLLAGSYGKMGAAVLASKACLKAGVGLLTTHVPRYGYNILQTAVPEAMVSIDRSDILISEFPDLDGYDAIGAGPGIGVKSNTCTALAELLDKVGNKPLVLDADALNILAQQPDLLDKLSINTVLTPHPKEFQRLAGGWDNDFERLQLLTSFAKRYHVVVVLKGAHTTTALPDGSCYFNSTGNPGMASAGSGDVLTGIILGLMSQGIAPSESAILGVYLHGLAGDLYVDGESEESLTALEIVTSLGKAFKCLRG
jgi:ADP-dependent NAD(P)H-hydrate dehydratase / NAD(P)H-hydrate epimerase